MSESIVERRLAALDLRERVALLTGASFWRTAGAARIGLHPIVLSDGPVGVRGETLDERVWSLCLPCPSAVGAAWDPELARELGSLLATEARRRGVHVVLTPGVNLHRTPWNGRHFEYVSEDPLLTAAVATGTVRGLQDGGVGAAVKHFAGNEAETGRKGVDNRIGVRALHELYLAPFEAVLRDARPWLVMAAYNGVNGSPMTASPLLSEPLTGSWAFDGVVVSDWEALITDDDGAAARGPLGLLMPGPDGPWGPALVAAVERGDVPEDAVADKVRRLLRLAGRVGRLDGVAPAVPDPVPVPDDEHRPLLRRAAAAGTVLLHDRGRTPSGGPAPSGDPASSGVPVPDGGPAPSGGPAPTGGPAPDDGPVPDGGPVPDVPPGLPLPPGLRRVAVLGPHAAAPRVQGGGSARTFPRHVVSPVDGLRRALDAEIVHTPGVFPDDRPQPLSPAETDGLDVTLHDATGAVLRREHRHAGWLVWPHDPVAARAAEIVVRTRLRIDRDGGWLLALGGIGHYALAVDGEPLLDETITDEEPVWPPYRGRTVPFRAGDTPELTVRYRPLAGRPDPPSVHVAVRAPRRDPDAELAHAVALAAGADAAVVVVGTSENGAAGESEGADRTTLALPGRQDELVRAVAAANPHTVVVLACGAPVLLPWLDETAATVLTWFAGQECGDALADVLTGAVEPGGRLPTTWPDIEDDLPPVTPAGGALSYAEGLRVGHRSGRTGRLPFGHGLGYTTWALTALRTDAGRVHVDVTNTGARAGRQVVQVYLSRRDSTVERPVRWLAGFAAVTVAPGRTVTVSVPLAERAFAHHDGTGWTVEPGPFTVHAGLSAGHLPLTGSVVPVAGPSDTGRATTRPTAAGPTATGLTSTGPTSTGPTTGPTIAGPTIAGPTATGPITTEAITTEATTTEATTTAPIQGEAIP